MSSELKKRILSSVILLPIVFYIIIEGDILFNIFITIVLFLSIYEFYKFKLNIFFNFYGIIYLLISFYTIFSFRNMIDENSLLYFLIVIITCVGSDIGGFIFGKILKGPKLTKISPNKTYSGLIGAYILSCFFILFFFLIQNRYDLITLNFMLIVIIISTVSQLGDLFISFLKRKSKIKDTGSIIPGHGGVLDRIDGMIFAFPISYLIFY